MRAHSGAVRQGGLLVSVAVAFLLMGATGSPEAAAGARVEKVLVISLPAVAWEDLEETDLPNLDRLFAASAIADLSVRGVSSETSAGDGYVTLGAGTRSKGVALGRFAFEAGGGDGGASGDPQEVALEFARRTGVRPRSGELFNFGIVGVRSTNSSLGYGAEVGALSGALAESGRTAAVLGNADHLASPGEYDLQRQATMALMNGDGIVSGGAIGLDLLVEDPTSAYGVTSDIDRMTESFERLWSDHDVVLVEAGDLARWDMYRGHTSESQETALRDEALERTDDLVGHLLGSVDPERQAVLVVGPYHRSGESHLTVASLSAPGSAPGLLRSGTTRRSGFVTLVDVAPTVLELLGVDRPPSMEGRPFEVGTTEGDAASRRAFLAEVNEGAILRDRNVVPAATGYVVVQALLWVAAALVLRGSSTRARLILEVACLSLIGFLPATHLATLLPAEAWRSAWYWTFVVGASVTIGVLSWLAGRRQVPDSLIVVLGVMLAVLAIDVVLGAPLQLNAVFGYSPTVAGRFAGFGNLAFAQLAAGSVLLACLIAGRVGGRKGVALALVLLSVVVLLDGAPFWGSDVGGVLALVPAAGVTAWLLLDRPISPRSVMLWGALTVVAIGIFGMVDLSRPDHSQTHLGRLIEQVQDEGLEPFLIVVGRKLDANLSVLTRSAWTLMVPVVLGVVGYLFWTAPGSLRRVQEKVPAERAALAGLLLLMVLGFALNDSGIAVPGVMLGVVNASLVFLLVRTDDDEQTGAPVPVDPDPARSVGAGAGAR